ncbi:LysM peptidoglycan-binding domain-containing protein [Candidatus Similichlamydia epinepheli]|uniref:LysM peptidoglycan-binding domain-containing protein n=1 Tax=Candidatus Similichlamydia epinepheli TaxID=1903953 RepID=UPI000D356701|nr:LysM domain-containing protein [Candidatus Similichlamydia epinepheli]
MISKRVILPLLLSVSLVSCFTAEKAVNTPHLLTPKGKKEEDKNKASELMRIRLQKLLSALMQLKTKVEKKNPTKLNRLQQNIRRVEILLKKIKISPNFVKQKELDRVRKDIQELIVEVRQDLANKNENKNKTTTSHPNSSSEIVNFDEKSHSTSQTNSINGDEFQGESSSGPIRLDREIAKRTQNDKVPISEVSEDLQNFSYRVQNLQKEWKVLLSKIEEANSFLTQCVSKTASPCLGAIHKQLLEDLSLIYERANESIYRVKVICEEINFFLSKEKSTISRSVLQRLRSDLQIECNDFQKSKERLEEFLLAQKRIPHWFLAGEDPPYDDLDERKKEFDHCSHRSKLPKMTLENRKTTHDEPSQDTTSSLENSHHEEIESALIEHPSHEENSDKPLQPSYEENSEKPLHPSHEENSDKPLQPSKVDSSKPSVRQQRKIDTLRTDLKKCSDQYENFRKKFRDLQSFDPTTHLLKELEQELEEIEDELKKFRDCLEKRLEEFLLKGEMSEKKLSKVHQKKVSTSRKLAKIQQVFLFLEEENDLQIKSVQTQGMHLIKKGESICTLSNKYGVSVESLLHANPKQKEPFREGDLIHIPLPRNDR